MPARWGKRQVICEGCGEQKHHYSLNLCRPCYRKRTGKINVCKRCQRVGEHQAKGLCKTCYGAQYERANPEKIATHRRNHELRKRYGLSREAYDALIAATPTCQICARTFSEDVKTAVDHCHTSGKVRGILCHGCNKGLGHYADSPERLRKAAEYLEKNG